MELNKYIEHTNLNNTAKLKDIEKLCNEAIKYNPSMLESVKPDSKRKDFFENLDKVPFDKLVKKYTYQPSVFKKIKFKIKGAIKKIIKRD